MLAGLLSDTTLNFIPFIRLGQNYCAVAVVMLAGDDLARPQRLDAIFFFLFFQVVDVDRGSVPWVRCLPDRETLPPPSVPFSSLPAIKLSNIRRELDFSPLLVLSASKHPIIVVLSSASASSPWQLGVYALLCWAADRADRYTALTIEYTEQSRSLTKARTRLSRTRVLRPSVRFQTILESLTFFFQKSARRFFCMNLLMYVSLIVK